MRYEFTVMDSIRTRSSRRGISNRDRELKFSGSIPSAGRIPTTYISNRKRALRRRKRPRLVLRKKVEGFFFAIREGGATGNRSIYRVFRKNVTGDIQGAPKRRRAGKISKFSASISRKLSIRTTYFSRWRRPETTATSAPSLYFFRKSENSTGIRKDGETGNIFYINVFSIRRRVAEIRYTGRSDGKRRVSAP